MADILSNYITPLYGENTKETMEKYDLEPGFLYNQFGTTIKIKSKNRFFLLTAKHCADKLDGKYPSAFFTLVNGLAFSNTMMPIKAKYTDIERYGYSDDTDIAFYEIDTNDNFWRSHKEGVIPFFFNLDVPYSTSVIEKIITSSGSKGFIYGFPEKEGVDHERCTITPNEQIIPVSNIKFNKIDKFKLDYDLNAPPDFDDNNLFGMSGGGLFCKSKNAQGQESINLIGMHIRGEHGNGQSIISPFFAKPTDTK